MREEKVTTVQGREVVIRQLTVHQVRDSIEPGKELTEWEAVIQEMAEPFLPYQAVKMSTGVEAEELAELSQEELDGFFAEVSAVNPSLARLVQKMLDRADALQQLAKANRG
jgi:phosphoserine phosphatase